ncbi:MAG TPA: hypothetical protein VF407_24215 [Polyangiaceae bacterium]
MIDLHLYPMRVDLTSSVRFDLPQGSVHTTASGLSGVDEERALLVPVHVLALALASASPDVVENVARAIGDSIGKRAAGRFGGVDGVRSADVDAVVSSLGAEVALAGFGVLSIERWGRAVVLVLAVAPAFSPAFYAPLLETALATATSWRNRGSLCCTLVDEEGAVRYLVSSITSADQVRRWLAAGIPWIEAVRRLQSDGRAG